MEEWKEYRLGDLCSIFTGKKDVKQTSPFGSYPFFSCAPTPYKSAEYIYDGKAVIVAGNGSFTGRVSYYIGKFDLYQRTYACVPLHNNFDFMYLYYFMKSNFEPHFMGGTRGSSIPYIVRGDLANFIVLLPTLSEQKRIAELLKSLDDKIEVNKQINDNLEQQAQALFKSWFVDFEPFKDSEFEESELGMIPKGWKVGKVEDFCNVFTGKKDVNQSLPKGKYPFFSCSPTYSFSDEYIYDGEAIIIAGNGSYTGRTSFYLGKYDLYQRTYSCVLKNVSKKESAAFIYFMMKQFFEPIKMGGTRGSSIPYIVRKDITLQKFAYEDELMDKFSKVAYNILVEILNNNKESRHLAELRDTLLPRLMSGELKVKDIEKSL